MFFISCGETSGDRYAASLCRHLKALDDGIDVHGNGGEFLRKEGVFLLSNTTSKSTIGFIEPIRYIGYYYWLLQKTKRHLRCHRPKAVILIDHQGFNIPLAKWCQSQGIPVYSLFAPQYWIWGKSNHAKKFISYCHTVFCVFSREYDYYSKLNSDKVCFIGHPLLPDLPKRNLDKTKTIIGLFPGSRVQEIKRLLPLMLDVVKKIRAKNSNIVFKVSVSSSDMGAIIQEQLLLANESIECADDSRQLISEAFCSIVSSGTVTLEHALIGTPCVSIYKLSSLSFWLVNRFIYPKVLETCDGFMSLPNILMRRQIIPEFFQNKATVDSIYQAISNYLDDVDLVKKTMRDFDACRDQLKTDEHPFKQLAKMIF